MNLASFEKHKIRQPYLAQRAGPWKWAEGAHIEERSMANSGPLKRTNLVPPYF